MNIGRFRKMIGQLGFLGGISLAILGAETSIPTEVAVGMGLMIGGYLAAHWTESE